MEGIFTVSLDFELHWGVFDKRERDSRMACYRNTLNLIPQMLQLFTEYQVHVTWATVGSLFAENKKEWEALKPSLQPDYVNQSLSAYQYAAQNGLHEKYHDAHFAPQTVAAILQYPGQELGTHTFSHYYCLEQVNGAEAFGADLAAAAKAASLFGTEPVSLVFPRNQFNPQNLATCLDNGIKVVRSNPATWFWSPIPDTSTSIFRKVFRTGDAYVPMSTIRNSYPLSFLEYEKGLPLQLPASRLLRSWSPKYPLANKLALRRVIKELETAAQKKECYHLWWHPENFGDYPEQNMENLKVILEAYKKLQKRFGMQSWNMGEYLHYFEENKEALTGTSEKFHIA